MHSTVMVVEDDETLADKLSTYRVRNGWRVQVCGSAQEAMELLGRRLAEAKLGLAERGRTTRSQ